MVNKAALGVLAVVVIGVVGLGMLVGTVMTGGDGPASNDDGGAEGPAANGTTTSTVDDGTPSASSPDADADEHTPMLPRRFESSLIAENISRLINDARENENLSRLDSEDATATDLAAMARGHSRDMADAGYITHNVDGTNVSQRYRNHDLFDHCTFDDGTNIRNPENTDRFEVVGFGTIGQYHEDDGNRTFIGNESQAARIVVDDWLKDRSDRERLLYDHFNRVGVGVELTRDSGVYVTANFCP